uniref:Sorting nexin-13 n=1 Tax=Globodera rostochiensis TaxID=31243 RepID=A0A914I4D0_GLORO
MVRPRVLCIFGGLLFLLLFVGPTALFVLLLIAITFIFGFVVFLIRDGVGIKRSLERTHANWVNDFRFSVRGQWDAFARGCTNPFSDEFIYAEKHSMTNSELLDPLLEEILDNIMRDYVDSCLKRTARRTIIALKTCLSKVDWATLLTRHIVDDFASHLRLYRKAKERLQFQKEFADRTDDLESVFFDLELEMERSYCRDLVSTSPAYESAYLHDIGDVLLYLLMPSEDFRSRPLRFLIREILVSSVFVPLLDRLSEPSVVNRMIVWLMSELPISTEDFVASIEACKSVQELEAVMESVHEEMNSLRSKGASLQRENGSIFSQQLASLEFTENIIKRRMTVLANWSTTAAAESANSNQNWPLPKLNNSFARSIGSEFVDDMDHSNFVHLPITVVLTNTVALSHFVEFLNQVGGQSYIDFYLAIEGFNVSMEHQLRGLASGDTLDTDARETIREAALFMYHQYLSQEAITRVPLSEAIINKFLARLRNDEPSDGWFEQIQEKVVDILKSEDRFYPAFMRHALYSRMLVELDIITDVCAVDTESNGSAAFVADEAVEEEASVGSLSGASLAEDEEKLVPSTFDGGGVIGTRHHRLQQQNNNCRASPPANDGAGTSVLVAMLGVGHQGKQLFALYNVRVHRTSDCVRGGSSSNVLRRYSDFHSLHNFIIAKFPNLRTLSFPGKKTFNNLDQSFLEKRCKALNQYMHCIMQPSLLTANPGLEPLVFDFLTQKRYNGGKEGLPAAMNTVLNPLMNGVKAFGSAAVAMPSDLIDGIGKMGSELNRAASNVFKGASVNRQTSFARVRSNSSSTGNLSDSARVAAHLDENDSVESIPLRVLLLLVDEVFGLRAKNQWFRRRLVSLLRQFIHAAMGQSINRRIIDAVNWLTSEEQVAQYLAAFRDSFWADSGGGSSSLADHSPQLDSQKTRFLARFLMLSAVPEELRLFVGSSTVQSGVETVSEALQNRHLNRRLCYVVLERLLVTCFPKNHFNRLLPQLHSKSPRAAV